MKAQHTKPPYYVGITHPNRIVSAYQNVASTCLDKDEDYVSEKEKANAAFIVRACNAHEDLVEALKKITRNQYCGRTTANIPIINECFAAIAKAEGR